MGFYFFDELLVWQEGLSFQYFLLQELSQTGPAHVSLTRNFPFSDIRPVDVRHPCALGCAELRAGCLLISASFNALNFIVLKLAVSPDQSCCFSVLIKMLQQKQPRVCSSNGPKCRYTMDNKCPSMENGTPDESQPISESGWTMYFDQSLDEASNSYNNSRSLVRFEEDVGRNKVHEEDSSMASDASSGPQQPLGQLTELQNGGQRLLSSNHQDFNLTASHVAEIRNPKRTKLEFKSDAANEKDLYLLEDTASSPLCSWKV